MRRLALGLALVLLAPSLAHAEGTGPPGFPCVGRWQGLGQNSGSANRWTIDMVVTPPSADGPPPRPSEPSPPRPVVIAPDDGEEGSARVRFAGCGCSAAGTRASPPGSS